MPVTKSPLRYPGGKTQLHKFVSNLFHINNIHRGIYCEPFSGGAGVAVELLLSNKVEKIILNDFDIGIYSIWYAILNQTDEFIKLIESIPITIEEWKKQREIYLKLKKECYSLELAFSTFFLNRTNRSGIILGGPIGNMDQSKKDKIDCRFNKINMIKKIRLIASQKNRIELYNLDAIQLIDSVLIKENKDRLFIFFDPPYYSQGQNLYTNFFTHQDHVELAEKIQQLNDYHWITTYDYNSSIKEMYKNSPTLEYNLIYSANRKRKEKEYLFHSNRVQVKSYDKVQFIES